MKVIVNGDARHVSAGTTVADLLQEFGSQTDRGMAVAINGEVVPRSAWPQKRLDEEDRVEILAAIGGG